MQVCIGVALALLNFCELPGSSDILTDFISAKRLLQDGFYVYPVPTTKEELSIRLTENCAKIGDDVLKKA
jgi:hypothetical protein